MKKTIIWGSLVNALGTFVYIALVAWFFFNGERWFGNKPDNFFMPVLMLLLLVVSATITGLLVLGRPLQLYLDNHKKDGVTMLLFTLGWLLIFAVAVVFVLTKYNF